MRGCWVCVRRHTAVRPLTPGVSPSQTPPQVLGPSTAVVLSTVSSRKAMPQPPSVWDLFVPPRQLSARFSSCWASCWLSSSLFSGKQQKWQKTPMRKSKIVQHVHLGLNYELLVTIVTSLMYINMYGGGHYFLESSLKMFSFSIVVCLLLRKKKSRRRFSINPGDNVRDSIIFNWDEKPTITKRKKK